MVKVLILLLVLSAQTFAQYIETCQVRFRRVVNYHSSLDTTSGTIYFKNNDYTIIDITSPLNQILFFGKKDLQIYYPSENKLFNIKSRNPFSLPFFLSFLSVIKEDNGLIEPGFQINNSQKIGDTLIVSWKPPKNLNNILSKQVMKFFNDKLVFSGSYDLNDKLIVYVMYSQHLKYINIFFPTKIMIVQNSPNNKSIEEIEYFQPTFNEKLPENILRFNIPPTVERKEIIW
jgi:hypothetical protein